MKAYLYFFVVLLLVCSISCKSDVGSKKNLTASETETVIRDSSPEIKTHQDTVHRDNWRLRGEEKIEGMKPYAVARFKTWYLLSDVEKRVVLKMDTAQTLLKDTIAQDVEVRSLNYRVGRLLMPIYDRDSVFVFRGGERLFKFNFPFVVDRPTTFDGYTINHFGVCDNGNDRVVLSKDGDVKFLGTKDDQTIFNKPTGIRFFRNKLYVLDSGNKRIVVYTALGEYVGSFGDDAGMTKPLSIYDDENHLYVLDGGAKSIFVFSENGTSLYTIPLGDSEPADMFIDWDLMYVSIPSEEKLLIYKNDNPRPKVKKVSKVDQLNRVRIDSDK